ncbi:MAG TPA: hypothetical protein VG675_13515 [Bryobacteraceae bacterium]|nr:hypothetical protein [Bryobacteraceae bacterium]
MHQKECGKDNRMPPHSPTSPDRPNDGCGEQIPRREKQKKRRLEEEQQIFAKSALITPMRNDQEQTQHERLECHLKEPDHQAL